jgi:hypothetical protein
MAKPRIYVETSVISYLTARPSRDLLVAARQEWTRQWWEAGRSVYDAKKWGQTRLFAYLACAFILSFSE